MAVYRVSLIPKDNLAAPLPKIAVVAAEGKGVARQIARDRFKDYIITEIVRMGSHSVAGRKEVT